MSEKKNVANAPEVVVEDAGAQVIEKAKGFWGKFKKPITYGGGAIVALVAGWYGYNTFIKQPQEEKANDAIWHAQQYFAEDSLTKALNGDGQYPGFEKVAKTYSGTKAGNLAKFYSGVCALRLKEYQKAVTYLKDFSTSAKEIQAIAYSRLGDAYSELKKNAEAVNFYAKAGRHFPEQESLSAENLFRAGLLSEMTGKKDDAIKYYKEVKDKYGRTDRGYQIDKYLAALGVVD
jgi:tetratricopeptide (TPR) repeat protein